MIYVDTPTTIDANHPTAPRVFKGRPAAHLQADTEEELRAYALKIGLLDSWIQNPGTARVHFDLTGNRLRSVLADPNVKKTSFTEMPYAKWIRERIAARKATELIP